MSDSTVRIKEDHGQHKAGEIGLLLFKSGDRKSGLVYVDHRGDWQPLDNLEMIDLVEIKRSTFKSMQDRLRKLEALEAAGVDNWSGYDMAMDILESM